MVREDLDGDEVSNADEELLGTDPTAVDTDGDGLVDGDDIKPLDSLATMSALSSGILLPISCSSSGGGSSSNPAVQSAKLLASNHSVLLEIVGGSSASKCTLTWPHTVASVSGAGGDPAAAAPTATELHRSGAMAGDLVTTFSGPALLELDVRAGEVQTWKLEGADFNPLVDKTFESLSHELGDGSTFEVRMADYAIDPETASSDLMWSAVSTHDADEVEIMFANGSNGAAGPIMHVSVDTSECRVHTVALTVEDAAGGVTEMNFQLNLLGGDGAELLVNGHVDAEVADGAVGSAVLPGWKMYTWDGTYVVGRTSGTHG